MRTKKELRKEILQLRDALNVEERKEKSHLIAEKVIVQNEFIEADKILLSASIHVSAFFAFAASGTLYMFFTKA